MHLNRITSSLVGLLVVGLSFLALAQASAGGDPSTIPINGTVGLSEAGDNSCIAVWVSVADDMAISGIKWYNNDGAVAFPEVLVQSGTADYPVALSDAFLVAEGVYGESLGWSEVAFSEPVACASEGLYVIFQVPPGALAESEGLGGGPAIGYTAADSGYPGWMSADGEDWSQMHPDFGYAVSPVFVDRDSDMYIKDKGPSGDESGDTAAQDDQVVTTTLKPAAPNPFNPQTTLSFGLREDGHVELAIYNLKGELVKQLVSQRMSAGEHSVVWNGRDNNEASLASGVYFARFAAGEVVMTQRLALIQ